jgi:hypothetical protein
LRSTRRSATGKAIVSSPQPLDSIEYVIAERDLALATEHPRGTERRTLLPYRDALQSPDAYARLPEKDRDVIVRWAEIRRLIRERSGVDHDARNLADPLIPADRLRDLVVEGERIAAGDTTVDAVEGDLVELVRRIRAAPR